MLMPTSGDAAPVGVSQGRWRRSPIRLAELPGQVRPAESGAGGRERRLRRAGPGGGDHPPRAPEPLQFVEGTLKGLGQAVRLGQQQAHRPQGRLALPGVVLGGDIPQAADHHAAAGVRVLHLVEAGRDPEPAPIAVRDGSDEAALALRYELGKCVAGLIPGFRIGVLAGPPRVREGVRQAVGAVTQDGGEGGVDLDHAAGLVAEEERLVQGIDQRGAPPGVVAAQPGQFHVSPGPAPGAPRRRTA